MRRTTQFSMERDTTATKILRDDIDNALNEMLFRGGNLNLSILGANQTSQPVCAQTENGNTKE
ncbi:hypothetical protein SH449x_001437 [Pirellulaceae bacterium SH449]